MKYQNNVKYQGNFGGVAVTFSLQGFSQKTVEAFNEKLAKEALKTIENERSDRILS
jgi:tRNA/tmRNA/rRNA uracil-C5-methylase (TrmA/RlmC/RlmD family)